MAKPSTPSRASRNAPQRKVHRYVDALFTDDFGRQSKLTTANAKGFAKKKLDTAAQSLQLKSERRERKAHRIEVREWRAAERSVAAEQRESDHRSRMLWRSLRTKVPPDNITRHKPPKERRRDWPYASVALPKYDGPIIDRQGQRGVFMRVRYYSRKTAEAGVSQRVVKYCFNGAALDQDGGPYVATNIGATIDEALCGFDHLEQVNWGAQSNAKLLMHGILAVDHRQSPDEMMTVGLRWAEECLGRFDLPYLVTLHAPPPDGDQRNWHLHVLWSFRPMVRTGDHEWQVGEMLRTDLDNPKAMKVFREMFATVMTRMSFEAGQNQVWTAKSNADRGLAHETQDHLGSAKTNQARNGEYVAENEENHERVMRSKAAVIDDTLRHDDAALAKAQNVARAITARFARLPVLTMAVPERVVPAKMTLEAAAFNAAPHVLTATIALPTVPAIRIKSTDIAGSVKPPKRSTLQRSTLDLAVIRPPLITPGTARIDIPNLRPSALPTAEAIILQPASVPILSPRTAVPAISPLALTLRLPLAEVTYPKVMPPWLSRPIIPQVLAFAPSWTRPTFAETGSLDHVIARVEDARKRDEERRKREDEIVARAVQAARAVADQQTVAERRQLQAIATEAESRTSAWRLARAKRERAMVSWDEAERLDNVGLRRPGRTIERPDAKRDASDPVVPRSFPRLLDHGIDD